MKDTHGVTVRCVRLMSERAQAGRATVCSAYGAVAVWRAAAAGGGARGSRWCGARLGVGQIVTFVAYRPPSRPHRAP